MSSRAESKTSPTPASTSDEAVEISRRTWARWRYAKRQAKLWASIAADVRAELEAEIGTATQATIDDVAVISWKEGEKRNEFDKKAFGKDYPELLAQYTIKKPGNRPFNETIHAAELDPENEDEE